jgi:hypothetical protein
MQRAGETGRRVLNFCDCGNDCWVMADGGQMVLTCNKCHDRLCDPCQRERRQQIIEGIMLRLLDAGERARFCTFTLKHQDAPLSVQIDRLLASFKLLRPHLHVIQVGPDRVPLVDLSIAWKQITGDSYIVHVEAITDHHRQLAYVTKYSTKPLDKSVLRNPARLDEFVVAIKGRRLFQCFGSWSKAHAREDVPARTLRRLGALCTIHDAACRGEIEWLVIMHQLHHQYPKLRKSHPLPPHLAAPPQPARDASNAAPDG